MYTSSRIIEPALSLVLLNLDMPAFSNSVDPDQLPSSEANWSGCTLFGIGYVNLYEQPRSNNLIGWKKEVGVATLFSMGRVKHYCIYPKHWRHNLLLYFSYFVNKFLLPSVDVSTNSWMNNKQCRHWSDATSCSIWSMFTLFAQACLSKYIGY